MSGRILQDDLKKHARRLYLAVGEDLKPRYSHREILGLLERKFDEKVSRMTLHRWATDGQWDKARKEAITQGMAKAATDGSPEPEVVRAPKPEVTREAVKQVDQGLSTVARAKQLLTDHIADYLKGTRVVSMNALALLGEAIKEHTTAKQRLRFLSQQQMTADVLAEMKRLELMLLTPMECVKIARLGNVAQGAQLNIILEGDTNVSVQAVTMTWESGVVGPPPPMPRTPQEQESA